MLTTVLSDSIIIEAIKSVTRKKEEQYYFDFIERARNNDIGRLVKIYDLENNMDIKRLSTFGDYEQKRLKKYWYAWKYLKGWMRRLNSFKFVEEEISVFEDKDPSDLEESQTVLEENTNEIEESEIEEIEEQEEIKEQENQQVLEEDRETFLELIINWIKKLLKIK